MSDYLHTHGVDVPACDAVIATLRAKLAEVSRQRDLALEGEREKACARDAALARVAQVEAALGDAVDVAIWMSGSTDFSPGGIAHEGWEKARPKLHAAMRALSSPPPHDGEGVT